MITVIKKVIFVICVLLLAFPFCVSAEKEKYIDSLKPYGDFYTFDNDEAEVEKSLSMTKSEIEAYLNENKIVYFAVDKENRRQIKLSVSETDFSNSIINLNGLTDESIINLLPEMCGIEGLNGSIILNGGQKFVKVELKSTDSGGDYLLTQYITVAERKMLILSFNNATDTDTEYIDKTFESFSSPLFDAKTESSTKSNIILIIIVLLVFISVIALVTVIKDLTVQRKKEE